MFHCFSLFLSYVLPMCTLLMYVSSYSSVSCCSLLLRRLISCCLGYILILSSFPCVLVTLQACTIIQSNFCRVSCVNPLSANITKWSNTIKQFVDKLPRNCLSVFDQFVGLALKGLSLELLFCPLFLAITAITFIPLSNHVYTSQLQDYQYSSNLKCKKCSAG